MQTHSDVLVNRLRRLGEHHDHAHRRAKAAHDAHKALERPQTGEAPGVAAEATGHGR